MLEKLQASRKGEQQGPLLANENQNLSLDKKRKQTRLKDKQPHLPDPCIFITRYSKHLSEIRSGEEKEAAQGQQDNVLPNKSPVDLLGPIQTASVLPVFLQHMPANDGIPAYHELIQQPIEILDLKHLKQLLFFKLKNFPPWGPYRDSSPQFKSKQFYEDHFLGL